MSVFHQPHNSMGNHSYNVYIYNRVNYELHFHKNYEIIYIMRGKAICTVNKTSKTLKEGDFAFCLSNEIHSIKSIGNSKVWIGVFSQDFIHEFAKFQKGKRGTDFSFRCSKPTMKFLSENLIKKDLGDVFMIKSCLYVLCSEYFNQIKLEESNDKQASLIQYIVEYVDKNYKNPISLATLAESLGYEYCYFSKIFNKLFSMNFNDYINIYRISEACTMLIKSDMSVTEVAYASGFQSIRSFNNSFKKITNVSPSEYRKTSPIPHN